MVIYIILHLFCWIIIMSKTRKSQRKLRKSKSKSKSKSRTPSLGKSKTKTKQNTFKISMDGAKAMNFLNARSIARARGIY